MFTQRTTYHDPFKCVVHVEEDKQPEHEHEYVDDDSEVPVIIKRKSKYLPGERLLKKINKRRFDHSTDTAIINIMRDLSIV